LAVVSQYVGRLAADAAAGSNTAPATESTTAIVLARLMRGGP
jgi:hypothetical protein